MLPLASLLLPLLAPAVIVADALPDPNSSASIGWLVLTFAAACAAANQILSAVEKFRRFRGIDPDDDKRYPTREEHRDLRTKVDGLAGGFNSLQNSIQTELRGIALQIGRLEGASSKTSSRS